MANDCAQRVMWGFGVGSTLGASFGAMSAIVCYAHTLCPCVVAASLTRSTLAHNRRHVRHLPIRQAQGSVCVCVVCGSRGGREKSRMASARARAFCCVSLSSIAQCTLLKQQIPGLFKLRFVGQTTVSTGLVSGRRVCARGV